MRPSIPTLRHALDPVRSQVLARSDADLLARFRELDSLDRPMSDPEREEYDRTVEEIKRRSSSRLHRQHQSAPIWSQITRDVDNGPQV